jgi:hypothetical protein
MAQRYFPMDYRKRSKALPTSSPGPTGIRPALSVALRTNAVAHSRSSFHRILNCDRTSETWPTAAPRGGSLSVIGERHSDLVVGTLRALIHSGG